MTLDLILPLCSSRPTSTHTHYYFSISSHYSVLLKVSFGIELNLNNRKSNQQWLKQDRVYFLHVTKNLNVIELGLMSSQGLSKIPYLSTFLFPHLYLMAFLFVLQDGSYTYRHSSHTLGKKKSKGKGWRARSWRHMPIISALSKQLFPTWARREVFL